MYDSILNTETIDKFINQMLDISDRYEKDGDKMQAEYWMTSAEEFEQRMIKEGKKCK